MQSQTKDEMFIVLEKYLQTILKENIKAAPDKSHFFLTRGKFLGHILKRNTIISLKSRIDTIQNFNCEKIKRKYNNSLECLISYVNTYIKSNYT